MRFVWLQLISAGPISRKFTVSEKSRLVFVDLVRLFTFFLGQTAQEDPDSKGRRDKNHQNQKSCQPGAVFG
jgi:hypothetical protein